MAKIKETPIKGKKGERFFKWVVELEVHEDWVEDGYNPDDHDILEMLGTRLGWANMTTELKAKVIARPNQKEVRKVQGYKG